MPKWDPRAYGRNFNRSNPSMIACNKILPKDQQEAIEEAAILAHQGRLAEASAVRNRYMRGRSL